jgi:hypothetical protein
MLGLNSGTIAILQTYCETCCADRGTYSTEQKYGKTPTQISHFRQIPSADVHTDPDNDNFELFFM